MGGSAGVVWHYIWVSGSGIYDDRSDDGALDSAWIWREVEGVVDLLLMWFGTACFADVNGLGIASLQGGGDADLVRQGISDGLPGVADSGGLEAQAHGMHDAVGQQADEQVAFNPALDAVVHGA